MERGKEKEIPRSQRVADSIGDDHRLPAERGDQHPSVVVVGLERSVVEFRRRSPHEKQHVIRKRESRASDPGVEVAGGAERARSIGEAGKRPGQIAMMDSHRKS